MARQHLRNNRRSVYSWSAALVVHMLVLFASCSQPQSDTPVSPKPLAIKLESYHESRNDKPEQRVEKRKKKAKKQKQRPKERAQKKVQEQHEPVRQEPLEAVTETSETQEAVLDDSVEEQSVSIAAAARQSADNLHAALRQAIEKRKFYPHRSRSMHEQGTVVLRLRLRADGSVGALSVLRSSGFASLDWAAKKAVRDAEPLPAPSDYGLQGQTISIPLDYSLY